MQNFNQVKRMHEMALAESILKISLECASANTAKSVSKIGLVIGKMSGVETEALEFSFHLLAKGTAADGADLDIKRSPLIAKCDKCGTEQQLENYNFFCPKCTDGVLKIISGRELQVSYVEVE